MSSTVDTATALNYWLASYTLAASTLPVILIYCAYFVFSTPRHRRWRIAFNLGLAPLVATLFFFISYVLTTYAYSQLPSVTFSDTVKRTLSYTSVILDNVQASSGEICLAWMVYKVYSRKKFNILLPFIVLFICLRFASQIWTSIMILSKLDPTVAGSVRGILMMWNLLFFSFLFIYRYRIKLKNAYKGPRFYKTVLDVSLRNAIIPTLFVLPAVITHFFTHNRIMALVNGILTISFRLLFGIAIANSLYIINRGEGGSRKDRRNIEMHAMNTRHGAASAITALHLASSFGLERKTNKILESFLANLHDLYGGTKGYFVEKNRFGQVNVICGFAYEDSKAFNGANICSVDDSSHRGDVPWAALEYGLELMEPMIWDAELADTDIDELSAIMSDRKDNIESILILPVTSPESGKQKIIYIECLIGESRNSTIDLQLLEMSAQHLAASLDSARLFEELEQMNRSLENMVQQRTAELEHKTVLLEQAKQEALQAASSKSIFLSNMSHEIRTPISQVVLASELMGETALSNEAQEYVNIISNSGRLLLNLVNDVLDLSKLDSGKVTIENIPFNLFELIQITMDAFSIDEDVKVAYYIQEGTPQSVMGDETRLRQIITNLVSNAIKFTSKGYVLLFVSSDKAGDDEYGIKFRIIDTGCGIASDKVDKIFQRFEQEDDSITRKFGGTGLGLSICQNLCELMGSHITVTSELNRGSQFTFPIRFKQAKSTDTAPSRFLHTLDTRSRILLLQSPTFTFESKSILEYQLVSMGSSVKSSSFPISAQDCLTAAEFDAVVVDCTDLNLPSLQEHLDSLFKTTLLTASNVLVIYSASQRDYVARLAFNRPNLHLIQYPHKQSGLFRQVASYLNPSTDTVKYGGGGASGAITQMVKADDGMTSSPRTSDGNFGEIAILLVEDNIVNQKVIQKMISRLGFTVDLADNGLIATEMVQKKQYDLILMDVRMPVMDGLEATRQIRMYCENLKTVDETNAKSPFIVGLSADVLSENRTEGLNSGMDMYLSKPVSRSKLQEVINEVYTKRS